MFDEIYSNLTGFIEGGFGNLKLKETLFNHLSFKGLFLNKSQEIIYCNSKYENQKRSFILTREDDITILSINILKNYIGVFYTPLIIDIAIGKFATHPSGFSHIEKCKCSFFYDEFISFKDIAFYYDEDCFKVQNEFPISILTTDQIINQQEIIENNKEFNVIYNNAMNFIDEKYGNDELKTILFQYFNSNGMFIDKNEEIIYCDSMDLEYYDQKEFILSLEDKITLFSAKIERRYNGMAYVPLIITAVIGRFLVNENGSYKIEKCKCDFLFDDELGLIDVDFFYDRNCFKDI